MARPKKSAAPAEQKANQMVLTEEQLDKLKDISAELSGIKNTVRDIGEDRELDIRTIGFIAGRVYTDVNNLENALDEIIHQVDSINDEDYDLI